MTWVSFTKSSGNQKVGNIPVTTSDVQSCPSACPLKDTDCYARFGPLGWHWKKIGEGGRVDNWAGFCKKIKSLASGQLWRHNQAGDLPPSSKDKRLIDRAKLWALVLASKHTKGWTYTHYDMGLASNRQAVKNANNQDGLTVNLSADSLVQADEYANLEIAPVTVTLPQDAPQLGNKTPEGRQIVVCPAQTTENMSCKQCQLCQKKDRQSIVGFRSHGIAAKRMSAKIKSREEQ